MEKQRPYIMLKWAETADGFIARGNFDSKWISSTYSRRLVHKWRAEEAAILVGTNTAHYDNPMLTVRDWSGKNPVRIVIDRHLRLNASLHLRSEEHTSELQSRENLVCRLLLEKKNTQRKRVTR